MKLHQLLPAFFCLTLACALRAQSIFTFTPSGISSSGEIVIPSGTTLVKAVNVGSASSSTVGSLTFEADLGNGLPAPDISSFAGNGYNATATTEPGANTISGASFTDSTTNINKLGDGGNVTGITFTGLVANTDYVFDLFLTDNYFDRGAQFNYSLGSHGETQYITQTLGNLNLYQVSFNSGTDTTFDWSLVATLEAVMNPRRESYGA